MCTSQYVTLIFYEDNALSFSKDKMKLDLIIKSLFEGDENFEFNDEGNMDKYLDMDFKKKNKDKSCEIRQPFLIDKILELLKVCLVQTHR